MDTTGATQYHDRILVVEDEDALRHIVAKNLRARGFWVDEANCVDAAEAAIEHAVPCLILLDIDLPDRTGWDLLRSLHLAARQPAVVLVTATNVQAERLRQFEPAAVLTKPFPMDALLRLAEKYCRPTEALVSAPDTREGGQ